MDWQGELQYFIGVQLDGSEYLEPERHRLSKNKEKEGAKVVQETANNIDGAVRELPDANMVLANSQFTPLLFTICLSLYLSSCYDHVILCDHLWCTTETGGSMV